MGKLGLKQLQGFYNLGCKGEGNDQPVYLNSLSGLQAVLCFLSNAYAQTDFS